MRSFAVSRDVGRGSHLLVTQCSDMMRVVTGICTKVSTAELRDDILRFRVTSQLSELAVACGSSFTALFNFMAMVGVLQSKPVLRLAGRKGILRHGSGSRPDDGRCVVTQRDPLTA